jgi:hypothetical protein
MMHASATAAFDLDHQTDLQHLAAWGPQPTGSTLAQRPGD